MVIIATLFFYMELKIDFNFPELNNSISIEDELFLLGSCFTENIGERLVESKFNATVNPLGISFNPFSIHHQLERIIKNKKISENELLEREGIYFHLDFHSHFSGKNKLEILNKINSQIEFSHNALKKASFLIISYGTSFFYSLKSTKTIVNNCNKLPSQLFEKKIGYSNQFLTSFNEIYSLLNEFNSTIKLIFTISPVKHYRDGVIENSHSKAQLLCFAFETINLHLDINYFPSYEIQNDELRDYRFYDETFTHPNKLAINFIWEVFVTKVFNTIAKDFVEDYKKIVSAKKHKVQFLHTNSHKKFIENTLMDLNNLIIKYPSKNFKDDISFFSKQLDETKL